MFLCVSFWFALNSHLLQSYKKKFLIGVKYRLKCLENGSVIQRPSEGVFKLILEKEGSKADFMGSETPSLSVASDVPLAALLTLQCAVLQMGGVFP